MDAPPFLRTVATPVPARPSPAEEAIRRARELDEAMQRIYEGALARYQANILAKCPIMLGLFSNAYEEAD